MLAKFYNLKLLIKISIWEKHIIGYHTIKIKLNVTLSMM